MYSVADIYHDFFGMSTEDVSLIPSEGQVNLLASQSPGMINTQFLAKSAKKHLKLLLFRSLFKRDPEDASYRIDFIPKSTTPTVDTILDVPQITALEGAATLEHTGLYRTLLTGKEFLDADGNTQILSDDFIIRAGQSGYASEKTVLAATEGDKTINYTLLPGQRIVFAADTHPEILRGSLLLFGTSVEKRGLTVRDRGFPLLPSDRITTGINGDVTIGFPDATQTLVTPNQTWMLTDYTPGIGIHTSSLAVDPHWYYGSMEDSASMSEHRWPDMTLFDAYTSDTGDAEVSQIPPEIPLVLDHPTEIDFQSYFPVDTITKVDILKLPSSQWRRANATTIDFEMQKEKKDVLVRVTLGSTVREYDTTLVTVPPKLVISSLDSAGSLTGKLTDPVTLPVGIQSFIGGKSWTLNPSISLQGTDFSTSFTDKNPLFTASYNQTPLASIDRKSGTLTLENTTLTPQIGT